MAKRVAILQSNYIPWKGYFDLINAADEFILYDTVQFTKNDWRNRNTIKTRDGVRWITIPVSHDFGQTIRETRIADPTWPVKHWRTISQSYARAPFLGEYGPVLAELYRDAGRKFLSEVNFEFIITICRLLGIRTKISWSTDYELAEGQTGRLVSLCLQAGATEYISGPAAENYLAESMFEKHGIAVSYFDYSRYPEYPQLHGEFVHSVSVLDLLLNVGPDAPKYMKTFNFSGR